jgi:transcriptional regulator with XRE-family HTH domain
MPARPLRRSDAEDVQSDVGRRLRLRREERDLSLRELARRLGISPSAISQIETGKSRPSVSTLYAIVTELGMSLDELFSGRDQDRGNAKAPAAARQQPRSPRAEPRAASEGRHVQRSGGRKAIELETGVRWERLTPHADTDADFLEVVYDVGGSSCQGDRFIRHSGREYGLVLSGTLEVTVGFDSYTLEPGDSICFDSTVPHCLRNVGDEPVRGIWFVVGRQGDDRRFSPFEVDGGDGRRFTRSD